MCFFNTPCNPCNGDKKPPRPVYINNQTVGPRGPIGPMGPQGPQGIQGPVGPQGTAGPAGANAVSEAVYLRGGAQSALDNSTLTTALAATTPNATMTFSDNAVTLTQGYYLIDYGFEGSTANGGTITVGLYAGDTAIPNETVTQYGAAAINASASKTILFNAAATTALSLRNLSGGTVDFTNAHMTVFKIV